MSRKNLSLTQKKLVDMLETQAFALPAEIKNLPIHVLIRLLRKRLHMTQKNLADRAGLPQSTIARLESGQKQPKLQTVKKIFTALFCDFVCLPIPKIAYEEIVKKQARKTAEARIEYVKGTMALEKQLPSNEMIEELICAEQERLLQTASSEIWEV